MRRWLEPDITGPLLFRRPEHVRFDLHGPPLATTLDTKLFIAANHDNQFCADANGQAIRIDYDKHGAVAGLSKL